MSSKMQVLEDAERAELGEEDFGEFTAKLDEFRDGLSDKEKVALALIVVGAMDGEPSTGSEPGDIEAPSDEEMDAFAEKLNAFHDSLPGSQHLFLDAMLGKTWFSDEAEVQGYHWVLLDRRMVQNWDLEAYRRACARIGGDYITWQRRPWAHRKPVACWDWR
jgi:hypothetical protein